MMSRTDRGTFRRERPLWPTRRTTSQSTPRVPRRTRSSRAPTPRRGCRPTRVGRVTRAVAPPSDRSEPSAQLVSGSYGSPTQQHYEIAIPKYFGIFYYLDHRGCMLRNGYDGGRRQCSRVLQMYGEFDDYDPRASLFLAVKYRHFFRCEMY